MVLLGVGAALGVTAGLVYSESTRKKARKGAKKLTTKAQETFHRLPQPQTVVEIPNSLEDYALLDGLVCECSEQVQATLGAEPELPLWARETAHCVLQKLEPDIAWPPVPGDHPSIYGLQLIVIYEVSRQLQEDTLCLPEPGAEDPTPNPGRFLRPR